MIDDCFIPTLTLPWAALLASVPVLVQLRLISEWKQPYVAVARAKGLSENVLLLKYPLRVALSRSLVDLKRMLPHFISGTMIVSIALGISTVGMLFHQALLDYDGYLMGDSFLVMNGMTLIGVFLLDILSAWLDPRLRLANSTRVRGMETAST